MIITPCKLDLDLTFNRSPRTPGLHMSDIYGSLFRELEPERYTRDDLDDRTKNAYMLVGLSLEEMLEEGLRQRFAETGSGRPGEFVTEEGIIYSPDLIIFNGETRLGEIKLTWMSSREVPREPANGFPPKFDKYFVQMMAYCHHLETPYARLLACFVNGTYDKSTGMKPELLSWDITFTARELRDNWQMLKMHGRLKGML